MIRAELWDPWGVSIPNTPIAAPPDYPGSHEAGAAWGPYGPYAGAPGGGSAVLGEVFPGTEGVDAAAVFASAAQGGALLDAEAMPFVDDDQGKVGETHRFLEQGVRADCNADASVCQCGFGLFSVALFQAA